jgi:nucleoside-diphosphate-sugar epimerase
VGINEKEASSQARYTSRAKEETKRTRKGLVAEKMSDLLVTGASGFVGQALIPKLLDKGHKIYALSRHPPAPAENLIPLVGDITHPDLGLREVPKVDGVYHLAGIHSLRQDDNDNSIWQTNVIGTRNVIDFCIKHSIKRLYFTSTAYTLGRNPYETSKIVSEQDIINFAGLYGFKVTIFKPSVIMGTEKHPYLGHFNQFVSALIKMLRNIGLIKSTVEEKLSLPILEFTFRIKGNPDGKLNLVRVDAVADAIANIEDEGTFWLTNPDPPLLKDLVKWVGEFLAFDFRIVSDFKPRLLENQFMQIVSAFVPYLEGDNFSSDLNNHPPITREFIHDTIKRSLSL